MKLSAKVKYAIKAVTELAVRRSLGEQVRLSDLAKAQRIPKNFLLQLLLRLKNAGIVASTRGVAGGYALALAPERITLADVVRAIDEDVLEFSLPAGSARQGELDRILGRLWKDINESIAEKLGSVTLDLLAAQVSREPISYTI
ncbi:MAG: RrF2 family transcriptional regulator [Deltaproteobacteria bacterium]